MAKVSVAEFLELAQHHPVFDVRSPGEYNHAHIPGAISLPLFSDEERKVVGTAYKQQSREDAIKIGLDYYGVKMRKIVEEVESILKEREGSTNKQSPNSKIPNRNSKFQNPNSNTENSNTENSKLQIPGNNIQSPKPANDKWVLLHCWRGGMRSAAVAWLLELYGFKVFLLNGGYKAFRNWALMQFDEPYSLNILGGYTGSGKTHVLHQLKSTGNIVVDLEGIAAHKGSAFGGFGLTQPSQEMFENMLASNLHQAKKAAGETGKIWMEDESRRIGALNIPYGLWQTMRISPIYFLEIPFEKRLAFITENYGKHKKEELVNAVIRIQKRLGNLDARNAIHFLLEDKHEDAFAILLRYYDKYYNSSLKTRSNLEQLIVNLQSNTVNPEDNSWLLFNK